MAYLYDNNAPWAVRVVEVKKGVKRVNTKLNNIKTTFKAQVNEIKAQVNKVNKKVAKIKIEIRLLKKHQDRLKS